MDTPNTSLDTSHPAPPRDTFRTVGDVARHVRELIETSVLGLKDLALKKETSARERLLLESLASLRLRAASALGGQADEAAEKIEKTWAQYAAVFQVTLTLRDDLKNASSTLEANKTLSRVDQSLVTALAAMKDGNPVITEFCESITFVLLQLERQSSIAINGAQDM